MDSLAASGNIRPSLTLRGSLYLPYDPWPLSIGSVGCYLAGLEVLRSTLISGAGSAGSSIGSRFCLVRADTVMGLLGRLRRQTDSFKNLN